MGDDGDDTSIVVVEYSDLVAPAAESPQDTSGALLEKIENEEIKNESISTIVDGFFPVIFKMPKRILLQFLISFRQAATAKSIKVALVVFQLDVILSLPIYSLSAFLQYCLELLMYARQQLTMHQVQEVGR